MLKQYKKILNLNINLKYFILGIFFSAVVGTTLIALFNNYLDDVYKLNAIQRGFLEFPRELPGLLATFIIGAMFFLGDIKIIAISSLITALGFLGLGLIPNNYSLMIIFTVLWSTGDHIFMSMREAVAINLSSSKNKGYILGLLNSLRASGVIFGAFLIWLLMGTFAFSYSLMFLVFSLFSFLSFLMLKNIKLINPKTRDKKFILIFRKEYYLFYLLAALFGVRKQLFLVFAPWLLIKFYNQKAEDIAFIYLISAVIGIFTRPLLGKSIDFFGEKKILIFDAVSIFIISLVYIFVPSINNYSLALLILYTCFILDDLLFFLRTARTTYLYKTLKNNEDLAPTLSTGVSIEHLVSMIAPGIAGILWFNYAYYWVFIITLFFSILSFFLALKIKTI